MEDTEDKVVQTSSSIYTYTFRDYALYFLHFFFQVYMCLHARRYKVVDCEEWFSSSSFLLANTTASFFYLNKIFSLLLYTCIYVCSFCVLCLAIAMTDQMQPMHGLAFLLSLCSFFFSSVIILVLSSSK
jgi:4-amino-4-deoxy-L-arabinose transferase-like glycosyltransferase